MPFKSTVRLVVMVVFERGYLLKGLLPRQNSLYIDMLIISLPSKPRPIGD